jgi:hypothetical protein
MFTSFKVSLTKATVSRLRTEGTLVSMLNVQAGDRLLMLPPSIETTADSECLILARVALVAVKDEDREMVFDEDGNIINLADAHFLDKVVVPPEGLLTEKGKENLSQMYQ